MRSRLQSSKAALAFNEGGFIIILASSGEVRVELPALRGEGKLQDTQQTREEAASWGRKKRKQDKNVLLTSAFADIAASSSSASRRAARVSASCLAALMSSEPLDPLLETVARLEGAAEAPPKPRLESPAATTTTAHFAKRRRRPVKQEAAAGAAAAQRIVLPVLPAWWR